MEKLIMRRKRHEPLQYIYGEWKFYGNNYIIEKPVLIPRYETEYAIDLIFKEIENYNKQNISFLEVGLGSGCISISLLHKNIKIKNKSCTMQGIGIDIKEKCVELSTKNRDRILDDKKQLLSIYKLNVNQIQEDQKFDFIVSNPPYIQSEKLKSLQKQVIFYEDKQALDGGPDGLQVINQIIQKSKKIVKSQGFVFMEVDTDQCQFLSQSLKEQGMINVRIIQDQYERNRFIVYNII